MRIGVLRKSSDSRTFIREMLHLNGITKQYGAKVLFQEAEAHLGYRSRVALVGPNGAGKSTLTKIILGLEHPDFGKVTRASHLSIGYLPQELPKVSNRTVLAETLRMDGRAEELSTARRELETEFEKNPEGASTESLERYGRILEELEHLDEYRLEARAKTILSGMGFRESDFNRPLAEFSGGWLMRVALSRILLMDPDLLLLDEPTNHLDLESLLWLEDFLKRFRGAMLIISHDTAFLNRTVHEVLEIDQRRLWIYRGNLDSYVLQKEERLKVLRAQAEGQQSKIAEIEAFVARFGAKATKARQAQSRLKQLEKMEIIELPEERDTVGFRFPPAPHSGKEVVTAQKVSVSFPGKKVLKNLDWVIRRGSRTAIVGVNGAGKTTLLRLLSGTLDPTSGELKLGHEVKIGYYAQIQAESLNMGSTILKELETVAPDMPLAKVRAIAGAFLFTGSDVEKKCGILSGGEKARVALAKLLLAPSNFLVLDEPTNHLDVESRGVLLEALQNYSGTLCLVSHDREFVGPLVDHVLEIVPTESGSDVIQLVGGYEDYLGRKMKEAEGKAELSGTEKNAEKNTDKKQIQTQIPAQSSDGPVKPSNNQVRSWERERDRLEAEIAKHEARQAELQTQMGDPATYADKPLTLKLLEEQRKIESLLGEKLSRWEELCMKVELAK